MTGGEVAMSSSVSLPSSETECHYALLRTMHEDEFLETVRQEAAIQSKDAARSISEATLQTVGERITDGQAQDIAPALPDAFADSLVESHPNEADVFSIDEFTERVSERAGIPESDVPKQSRAVVTALSTTDTELQTVREQLPTEFNVIFEPAGPIETDDFLDTVQQRADVGSTDAARDATHATLQALGERLATGEAKDIALYLPEEFEAPLVESGESDAVGYSLDEFVQQVAQREDIEPDEARRYAHAVNSTVAETVSDRELDAAKKQLPDPFGAIFEPPTDHDNNT